MVSLNSGNPIVPGERFVDERVACVEEVAWQMGFITADDVRRLAEPIRKSDYGAYLLRLVDDRA